MMKKYSLSVKLFVSLSLILVLTVTVLNFVSNYAVMNSMEKEISKNCIGKLKVAENTVLHLKEAVKKDTVRLSVSSVLNELIDLRPTGGGISDAQYLIPLSRVMKSIYELVNTDSSYHSIYLYLEELGFSLTSSQGFVENMKLNDTGWMKYYQEYKSEDKPLSWIETRFPEESNNSVEYGSPRCVITYIYPLTPYTTSLSGVLVVNVQEEMFSNLINSNNSEREGHIVIINHEGDVISHVDKQLLSKNIANKDYISEIIQDTSTEGYLVSDINGSRSLVSFYKPEGNDWIYIGVFSLNSFMYSLNRIRMYTIYLSILIIIVGIVITFLISRKLYSPLKALIHNIKHTKGIDLLENENEMTIISKAFETLKKHDENLFNALERNKRNIYENYLNNLLRGIHSCEVDENLINLKFNYPFYVCSVMSIDKYGMFSKANKPEQQFYLKMLVLNIAEEVINTVYPCSGVNMGKGEIALIINTHSTDNKAIIKILKSCFFKIQNETKKVLDNTISIGIGSCCRGEEEIKTSYMEAGEALKLKLIYGFGSIISWSREFMEHRYYYPFIIERHILNRIGCGDTEGITRAVRELMKEIKNKTGLSSDNIIQIFNQLVGNTVIKHLVDSHIDMSHVFGGSFNIYQELSKKETLDDIEKWLIEIYNRVNRYCSKLDSDERDKLHLIMEYIQQNYKKDIGLKDIADYAGLSYSHARKVFKDETGENMVNYIHNIRINEARELLLYTDICIKDLAVTLGYNNDQSFTRAFKKIEGITPGEYRNKFREPSLETEV